MQASTVVGYNTQTVTGLNALEETQWYFVAVQFKGTGETEDVIKFDDLIKAEGLTAGLWKNRTKKDGTGSPVIQVLNDEGAYDFYYYVSNAYSTPEKTAGDNIHTGWANSQVLVTGLDTAVLKIGTGFWFSAPTLGHGTATITVAGEVKNAVSKTVNVKATDTLALANPFPTALKIKDIVTTLPAALWKNRTKKDGTGAPVIQVPNAEGAYDFYYYVSNAYSTAEKTAGDNIHTGWANSQVIASQELPVGQGFWLLTNELSAGGTITFNFNNAE